MCRVLSAAVRCSTWTAVGRGNRYAGAQPGLSRTGSSRAANGLRARVTSSMATDSCSMFRVCRTQFLNPRRAGITAMPHEQGDLIESLRKIAARKPDVLVPARGPLIENPQQAIERLITRLQGLMASHFIRMRCVGIGAKRACGSDHERRWMDEPSIRCRWRSNVPCRLVKAIGNSRLLVSRTGAGFLVDAGFKGCSQGCRKQIACRGCGSRITTTTTRTTRRLSPTGSRVRCILRSGCAMCWSARRTPATVSH